VWLIVQLPEMVVGWPPEDLAVSMTMVLPAAKDAEAALVQVFAFSWIVQPSVVAAPFFSTVTVNEASLPPELAVLDSVTERFLSVEAALKV
jgi:hypothetical protein